MAKGKAFLLLDIAKKLAPQSPDVYKYYWWGYLIASSAIGVLELNISNDIVTISRFDPNFKTQLVDEIHSRIKKAEEEKVTSPLRKYLDIIDAHFA
jgi:hypothetical protein